MIYCEDEMLDYRSSRKIYQPGERIVFDEGYRLAHLPLVNPMHPAIISEAVATTETASMRRRATRS